MDQVTFEMFMEHSTRDLQEKSNSEKIKIFINWCIQNKMEEIILRLSSEAKGGWSRNFYLDFTTSRIIITKKNFFTKLADLGYVAGLAPYPYLLLLKNLDPSKIRKQTLHTPDELIKSESFSNSIEYSNIEEIIFRKGTETAFANMFGQAIMANFLTIRDSDDSKYCFTLPVNKNGTYEQIHFWVNTVLPSYCRLDNDVKI
jgi:hypothetical protein